MTYEDREGMVFTQRQAKARNNVIKICRDHPESIGNYGKLVLWYWIDIDRLLTRDNYTKTYMTSILDLNKIKLTSSETITRAFRKLVEDGVIVVSEKTRESRDIQQERFREHYGQKRLYE
jgi:hypothetical protein